MTDLRAGRETADHLPSYAAGIPVPRPAPEPPPAPQDGVALPRLLAMTRVTAAQAVELGSGVLTAAAMRGNQAVAAPTGDQASVDEVVVGADGRVTVRPGERLSLGGILADIAGAARLTSSRPDSAAERLVAELDLAAAELPVSALPAVARRLEQVAASSDRGALRAQLGALAGALAGDRGTAPSTGPAAPRPTAGRAAPSAVRSSGRNRNAGRRIGVWLLTVLVLAGVVLTEFAVLRDKVARDIGTLLDAGRGGATPSAATKPDGLPIAPPAPAAAGRVRGVDLRPLAPCTPGARCALRVLISVVPGAHPLAVSWTYRIVDRCTGAVRTAQGGAATVPARAQQAVVVGAVRLPAGRAEGVVAVIRVPAAAASTPVLVGSCRARTG